MSTSTIDAPAKTLSDPELKAALQELRRTDNVRNWWFVVRTYLYLALVIGGAVWFFENREDLGIGWWANVPVALVAIVLVGAGQHQLSGLAHEGSHYILFRNRFVNDLASDLFTMFPLFASIYHYRLQHLAHHQFVNDPDRDPDVSQLKTSGHWLGFPLARRDVIRAFARQLSPFRLIRFMRIRAQYNATGTDKNPYMIKGQKPSKGAVRVGILYLLAMVATLTALFYLADDWWVMPAAAFAMWAVVVAVFMKLPDHKYHQSKLRPVIHARYTSALRVGFITLLLTSLAVATKLTGAPAVPYFLLLWVAPLFTAFAFFMILRQLVQHGNGGRGWINNTRTFLVAPFIRFAVFPFGQDYHLPHHMYATVPHYRLKKLHALLMRYDEYRAEALEVHGYFVSPERPQVHPTVVDVLGSEYAPRTADVHIDAEAVSVVEFNDKEGLAKEVELSKSLGERPV
ncbi:fatty acid desaturase : Fatty acid desaturase OS=Hyphomicrobium sp. (strain MC1) GN=HYPMC_1104 PE=4 SV=1: FA_desaturase [Gemmata massiliana]|uniref:Fatty acid desaturase domain-containing protein n=1 Tax=Gemmata massiliana TaxID=1210884 RepID=A0A6P2CZS1_9BACT|nr:fatty acid desaturase [Gemmata massiliana]VTR94379.1 fatty acid desaturase : Fatty acid desaturase OS=Hyphomicrobium sp. (strain MC1) GN=HYPMC_1104 PE=4 SV=1: FA_desaturase [Gemmata massiliana]